MLDGAQVDDLPALLSRHGFRSLSLFLEQGGGSVRRDSPYLVVLEPDRRVAFLAMPGVVPATVFWNAGACVPMAFYRHLRSLTLVRLPPARPDHAVPTKTRSAVFRHSDPATVAITLPVLTLAQRARFFGPAQALVIDTPEGSLQATRRADWPAAEQGQIRFDDAQMDAIAQAMATRSDRRIAAYLRDAAPDQAAGSSEAELAAFVARTGREGRGWGLDTEAGLGRFAWLQLVSGNQFARHDKVRAYVTAEPSQAHQRLSLVMTEMIRVQGVRGVPS